MVSDLDRHRYIDAPAPGLSDEFLEYPEVARLLRVSTKTIQRWALSKKLPSYKLGDETSRGPVRRVFRRGDIEAFLDSQRES